MAAGRAAEIYEIVSPYKREIKAWNAIRECQMYLSRFLIFFYKNSIHVLSLLFRFSKGNN